MGSQWYEALVALLQTTQVAPQLSSPPTFFTVESLFSAAGATTAAITVTSVLHGIFPKLPAKWFALVFSLLLTVVGVGVRNEGWTTLHLFLALLNGLVVYSAAVGVNNIVTAPPPGAPTTGRSYRWWG